MIDVNHQVNAVRRTVGSRVLEAGEAHVITIGQAYATDAADLWDALTNIDRIPRWFLPITGELRVGGRYQLEGNANGTVLSCDPPRGFSATWEFGGDVSWIEVRVFDEGPDRSRFELDHIAHVDDDTWRQYGPAAVGIGWDLGLVGLAIHLETGEAIEAGFEETWSASEGGKRFVAQAAAQWQLAVVASGADPDWARAATDRCVAFYLGEPQN
ncbi:SRPBCC family protein [Mycobacterium sp. LTG2003]